MNYSNNPINFRVSHLKHDNLVAADFLLGVDNFRNNDQCHLNSMNAAGVYTKHITRDVLRVDPKKYFDQIVADVNTFQSENPSCELLVNIDVDRNSFLSFIQLTCFSKIQQMIVSNLNLVPN